MRAKRTKSVTAGGSVRYGRPESRTRPAMQWPLVLQTYGMVDCDKQFRRGNIDGRRSATVCPCLHMNLPCFASTSVYDSHVLANDVGSMFVNCVDRRYDVPSWYNGHDTLVNNSQVLDAIHVQTGVHRGDQRACATWMIVC